jgi:hypothetical protein
MAAANRTSGHKIQVTLGGQSKRERQPCRSRLLWQNLLLCKAGQGCFTCRRWQPAYFATTLICLGLIASALGTVRVKMPLLYSALIASLSTGTLIVSRRSKAP